MELSKMNNIGKVLEQRLKAVGIEDAEGLRNLGSREAFMRLKAEDNTSCYNTLCALEGAVQGVRWHGLNEKKKKELKEFFSSL